MRNSNLKMLQKATEITELLFCKLIMGYDCNYQKVSSSGLSSSNSHFVALRSIKGSRVREEVRALSLVAEQSSADLGSESTVRGSDIRPAAPLPLKTHFLSGLTGLLPCDALSAECAAQIRDQDVETARLHRQSVLLVVDMTA